MRPGAQSKSDGSLWRDPPHYWEDIVYPAYVQASAGLFVGGDVEHGDVAAPSPDPPSDYAGEWQGEGESGGARPVPGLLLIEAVETGMDAMVECVCAVLIREVGGAGMQ
ncbi:hypothetical protein HWV62_15104 [Athelia sp. TMB]|nr:hypothetical protein HWV62_15104 [Athelia sp. TMB]